MTRPSPTFRLLAGLATTLVAVGIYSGYTLYQLRNLESLQTRIIDRNRTDTLLLLRIQNGLNLLALTMRDMLDPENAYPLAAWTPQLRRIRTDLDDAMAQESKTSAADLSPDQRRYLADSVRQFWDGADRVFEIARAGDEREARVRIRLSLQARQEALSTAVSRLLIQNNESEQAAAARTQDLYRGAERNVLIFLAAMVIVISLTSIYIAHYNRRVFEQTEALAKRRGELAQQLIAMQENIFRSISRDLHDDFGQILTAIGVNLQRGGKDPELLQELRQIVQSTLEKVRALSHALHPVALDEAGFESAVDAYLPGFERRTGITVSYRKTGESREMDREASVHLYRIMQEALNNVVKHSGSRRAEIRLRYESDRVVLEIEDEGTGIPKNARDGLGMVSMQERAEILHGELTVAPGAQRGTLLCVTVPLSRVSEGIKTPEVRL